MSFDPFPTSRNDPSQKRSYFELTFGPKLRVFPKQSSGDTTLPEVL